MTLSGLTPEIASRHVRCEPEDTMLPGYLDAAKGYILSVTGLSAENADKHPELAVAALILTADMYDNRQATVGNGKINEVLMSFLSAHDYNLLPGQAV